MGSRARRYRDPVHGDLSFGVAEPHIARIIDTPMFQRLRRIRQNAVANLVFHGAEHSRFAHSMGVGDLAGLMYTAAAGDSTDEDVHMQTILAGLLHDVGHGPFSHLLEEILGNLEVLEVEEKFDHERMTIRIVEEDDSEIADVLRSIDGALPSQIRPFIDKESRAPDRWWYSLVSSQLDADRIDYLMRDSLMAGVHAHRVDARRLISALRLVSTSWEPKLWIAVDERAMDILENFVLALDHMYEYVYFHKTVRAANFALQSTLHRALELGNGGKSDRQKLFPELGGTNPLWDVATKGSAVDLNSYQRLDESLVWALLPLWETHSDKVLSDLAGRLRRRAFPKAVDLSRVSVSKLTDLVLAARGKAEEKGLLPTYYVHQDDPSRVGYKRYQPGEGPATSILVEERGGAVKPLEDFERSISTVVAKRNLFSWLLVPAEIEDDVRAEARAATGGRQ